MPNRQNYRSQICKTEARNFLHLLAFHSILKMFSSQVTGETPESFFSLDFKIQTIKYYVL